MWGMVDNICVNGRYARNTQYLMIYLFIYLFESESANAKAGGGAEGEGEADSLLSREPNEGLDPRTLRS